MSNPDSVSVNTVVSTGKDLVFSHLADEVVILDLKSGVYHGLEAVGARVWELMAEPTPVREVRDALLNEYEVDLGQCERDLLQLLEELKSHGLVEVRDERAAKFARLGPAEKWLVVRTFGLLVRVRVSLWVLPFRRVRELADRLGRHRIAKRAKRYSAEDLTSIIFVAASYIPEASCLTQALVADAVLKRYGYVPVLKIGVSRSPAKAFQAHAWVELDGKVIIGQVNMLEQYTPLPTLGPVTANK